jgi:hypothetical protein
MTAAPLLSSLNKIQGKKWLCWLTWIDGRHVFSVGQAQAAGWDYRGVGRGKW